MQNEINNELVAYCYTFLIVLFTIAAMENVDI
jgi:hypothetical protein